MSIPRRGAGLLSLVVAFPGHTHLLFLSEDFLRQNCACCKLRLQTQFKVFCDYCNIKGETNQ